MLREQVRKEQGPFQGPPFPITAHPCSRTAARADQANGFSHRQLTARLALRLGLDANLGFITVGAQKDHAGALAPRKFTRAHLIAQVQQWRPRG
jgi:hypothetical protein